MDLFHLCPSSNVQSFDDIVSPIQHHLSRGTGPFRPSQSIHHGNHLDLNQLLRLAQLVSSTMQTLVSLTETSSPAKCSMLRFS